MTHKEIQSLYDYDAWADLRLLECLAALTPEQFKKDLGSSFSSIHGTLVHILSANKVWLDRWEGRMPAFLKAEEYPTVEVVKKHWDMYHYAVKNYLRSLSETKLNSMFQYTDFKGNVYRHPLYEQMQHKVNHSTYHRGQIVTMLRQLHLQVASTDLINYIRQKESHV
jgi:uncharacterized damage-inducible protein DinB